MTSQPEEIELKLAVASASELDALWQRTMLGPFRVHGRVSERQENVYYERADGRPLGQGLSLRWRRRAGAAFGELTLKLPGSTVGGIVERPEYLARLPADADPLAMTPPPEPFARLNALVGPVALRIAFTACTDRRTMELHGEGAVIELALDYTTMPGDTAFAIREVEAELKAGPRTALEHLATNLRALPGFTPETRSKHARLAARAQSRQHSPHTRDA